jgi:molybdopterin converting factor subunit 1
VKIALRYFALVAELTGRQEGALELASGATVADALQRLGRRHPGLAAAGFRPLVAVNRRYAGDETPLEEGDELAVFPPVSGG